MAALVAISVLLFSTWATAAPVPLEHFARNSEYESLTLSPDGRYFAAVVPHASQNAMVVIERATMAVTATLRLDLNQQIGRIDWANDERVVAQILQPQTASTRMANFGELFAMDADGDRKKLVFGYRVGDMQTGSRIKKADGMEAAGIVVDPLPDDRKHVLIASYPFSANAEATPTVFRLNIYSGTKKQMVRLPAPNASVVTNAELDRWASTSEDEHGATQIHWRSDRSQDWELLLHAPEIGRFATAHAFTPEDEALIVATNVGLPTTSLVRIDLATGERTVLLADNDYDLATIIYGSDPNEILGACFWADRPRCSYLDGSHPESRLLRAVARSMPEQTVMPARWTKNGSHALLWATADRNPGDYFLLDIASRKIDFLLSSKRWIDPNEMRPVQPIAFSARDGSELEGYLTMPEGVEGKAPTVVLVHGGPHGPRDAWHYDPDVQILASRGYAVLQVNFRGSGGYGAAFTRQGYQKWGTLIQDDITDGVRWAITEGYADPERLCIAGASFGGYSALMSAAREPDLYRCAIGHVGVYDLAMMFDKGDIPDSRGGPEYLERVLGSDPEAHQAQSPTHHLDRIKAALLISYGTQDDRAPPVQSTRLLEALDAAGKPYEVFVGRHEGHGFVDPEIRLAYYQAELAFLDRHIGMGEGRVVDGSETP